MKGPKKSYKILIIEDELRIIKAIKDKIVRKGWQAVVASNGEEGLRMAKKEKPDMILLDIVMPVMDGLTMLKKLRKTSDTPVLILTNLSDEKKLFEALREGSYDYLIKSDYSLDDVIKKIQEAFNNG